MYVYHERGDMITFGRFVNEAGCTIHHSLDFIIEYLWGAYQWGIAVVKPGKKQRCVGGVNAEVLSG